MKLLLLIGAGTSVELGVPTMVGLAEEFITHARQWNVEPEMVVKLMGGHDDIEYLIERLDQICSAKDSLESIGQDSTAINQAETIRSEVEWFVQHAAERVVPRAAQLLWGPILRASARVEVTLVTTNYDRAIELAANAEAVRLDDGYASFGTDETAKWVGFDGELNPVRLIKLHGSTDWYLERQNDEPRKLRHPMPLFGRASLTLPTGVELGSALILPSREKLLTREPYPRLSQAFLNAADACDLAIVVGSSLRDHHLRGAVKSMAQRIPVFMVNRQGLSHGIESGMGIRQTASAFLTGTLPIALSSGNPARALKEIAGAPASEPFNCLAALATSLDPELGDEQRCAALDELEAAGAPIDENWLRELMQDESPEVARYSLGFMTHLPDPQSLLAAAKASPHAITGSPYEEDLNLLELILDGAAKADAANKSLKPTPPLRSGAA